MKTSSVVASLLFGSLALAAPLDKRAYTTKTELVTETVIIYTTVWDGQVPEATSTPALFFEDKTEPTTTSTYVAPTSTSSSSSSSTSTTAPAPTVADVTTSTSTTSAYTPPPAPTTTEAPPKPSSTYVAPAPSSAAPAPAPSAPATGSGESYTGSYTMNYYGGGLGACGDPVGDDEMAVALGVDLFGDATVDYMTGKTTNKWCGKKIQITNGEYTAIATIKDRCPGCTGAGLDATPALWKATTGGLGGASGDRIYSMSWKVVS